MLWSESLTLLVKEQCIECKVEGGVKDKSDIENVQSQVFNIGYKIDLADPFLALPCNEGLE